MNKRWIKNKAGQITIFIIIAILIVAIVVLFFVFKEGIGKEKPVSSESAPIQNFVQECLDEVSESGVFDIAEKGGYNDPSKMPSTIIFNAPYYIKNNQNLMPSQEKIQDEISKGISRELILCLGNFALFPNYNVTKGTLTATAKIEPERVLVDVKYPLTIQKGESRSKIKDFSSEVPVRFGIVYDAVTEFVNQELEMGAEGTCVSCLLNATGKNNLRATFSEYDNKTNIFIIDDPSSTINEREFIYIFANEYN